MEQKEQKKAYVLLSEDEPIDFQIRVLTLG